MSALAYLSLALGTLNTAILAFNITLYRRTQRELRVRRAFEEYITARTMRHATPAHVLRELEAMRAALGAQEGA